MTTTNNPLMSRFALDQEIYSQGDVGDQLATLPNSHPVSLIMTTVILQPNYQRFTPTYTTFWFCHFRLQNLSMLTKLAICFKVLNFRSDNKHLKNPLSCRVCFYLGAAILNFTCLFQNICILAELCQLHIWYKRFNGNYIPICN